MNIIFESIRLLYAQMKSVLSTIRGIYWVSQLKSPIVTIFGGRSTGIHASYVETVHSVAKLCVEHNFAVLSGGGPGMMQAANCGAFEASVHKKYKPISSLGIGVRGVDVDYVNVCAPVLCVDSFFTRKWLLTHYSVAFIVFPGGIGTADELFTVLNLMKLGRLKTKPIILFGSAYWQPLVTWIEKSGIEQGFILSKYRHLFHVTDDALGAVRIIEQSLGNKLVG